MLVDHTTRIIQTLLDSLDSADQQLVLKRIIDERGPQNDVARMYSDTEVAERYGVHVRTVRIWMADGYLKGCQIASRWYSRADWLNDFDISALKEKSYATLKRANS